MEPVTHIQTIEILKAAKPLFDSGDTSIPAAVGALGAIFGALAAYVPNRLLAGNQLRELRKSTAFQIYAEIKATLEVERHRGYLKLLRELIQAFDSGKITTCSYEVQISDERFIVYKANLSNIGLLAPRIQSKIVLLYQLLEAIVQDIKPGGLLNSAPAGKEQFSEAIRLIERAKEISEQVMSEIEKLYPDVA